MATVVMIKRGSQSAENRNRQERQLNTVQGRNNIQGKKSEVGN